MKTIDSLKLTHAKFVNEFARGRARQPALALFATSTQCLVALDLMASTTDAARDAITLALVAEHHHRSGQPLWQSLLLVAYEPMLANVRRRLHDRTDAESRIVLAFLEAIAKLSVESPPSRVALHLRHATERGAFGPVSMRQPEPEMGKILAALDDLFDDPGEAAEALDVLLYARTGREALERLVADRYPGLRPRERGVVYERWQRQRRRALAHLMARFGADLEAAVTAA